jgi:hypothetical protein
MGDKQMYSECVCVCVYIIYLFLFMPYCIKNLINGLLLWWCANKDQSTLSFVPKA